VPTRPSSPAPERPTHHPPPRADGRLPVTITHLELSEADWKRHSAPPAADIAIERKSVPDVAFYRELYDRVGRPWLWYERRLLDDEALAALLASVGHELHVAREGHALVGFFELAGEEIAFFGLAPDYIGRHLGPWLLDCAIERGFARGASRLILNTNTLDHPRALATYRKAGFRTVRRETKDLQDPRLLWPEVYGWPQP
jgi:ribosomal protein S18 acetylase RimI-like enzyme